MLPVADDALYLIFFLPINQIWWWTGEVGAMGMGFMVRG